MTAVDSLSSVGISSLVLAEKSFRERHGRTILAGLSPFVARILETTGLLREVQHASGLPAAIQQAIIAKSAPGASTEHTTEGDLPVCRSHTHTLVSKPVRGRGARFRILLGAGEHRVHGTWGLADEPASIFAD